MLEEDRSKTLEKLMPALSNLYRSMATSRDAFLAQFNLSRPQMELLLSLKKQPCTASLLAKEFSVSASAVSQMIDQLVEKQLVERTQSTADRRTTTIRLSNGGKKLFAVIHQKFLERIEFRFRTVSVKEIEMLLGTIDKIIKNVNKG